MKASYLKRYPLTHLTAAAIIILSLAPLPEVPQLKNLTLADKWAHFIMYGGLCLVIWGEYLRQHSKRSALRLLVGAVILPAAMSGILELMQEHCTTVRNGDWLDFVANCIGVLLAAAIGLMVSRVYRGKPSDDHCSNVGRQ